MTEQQIRDGFEQLAGALAPPLDAQQRVDRRVRVRRRRRRAALAGAAVVGVAAVGGVALVAASGEDGGPQVATDPGSTHLVMTRPDGTTYAFDDVQVSCEPPVTTSGEAVDDPQPGTIWAWSPIDVTGSFAQDDEALNSALNKPFVMVQGSVAELTAGRTIPMPTTGEGELIVFIADTEGAPDGNEVVSDGDSTGTIRVLEASCDPVPVLRLEIDGVLGSEEGKQSLGLSGELP